MPKLISLVIPTRNRPDYLLDTLALALQYSDEIEVVVLDNSDTDALRAPLQPHIASGQVIYRYSADKLSVVANFERGVIETTGDYLMYIGDDDSIGPGLLEIAHWARRCGVDAVVSYRDRFIANYFWPGVKSRFYGDAYASCLFVHPFTGLASPIDSIAALRSAADALGSGLGSLPRLYHGLVSRSVVEQIRARHGQVFGGVSPDIYNATLVARHCRNAWAVDYPFVIPGASPSSTAAQGAARNEQGALARTEHITRFGADLRWKDTIPAYYSGPVVWAYSLAMALEQVPELVIEPNYGRLYARSLLGGRGLWRPVREAMKELSAQRGTWFATVALAAGLYRETASLTGRMLRRLLNPGPGGTAQRMKNLDRIGAAYAALQARSRTVPLRLPELVTPTRG